MANEQENVYIYFRPMENPTRLDASIIRLDYCGAEIHFEGGLVIIKDNENNEYAIETLMKEDDDG